MCPKKRKEVGNHIIRQLQLQSVAPAFTTSFPFPSLRSTLLTQVVLGLAVLLLPTDYLYQPHYLRNKGKTEQSTVSRHYDTT